jgi:CRP/FNR family cyclic AMP-dependent transcriptional regulator
MVRQRVGVTCDLPAEDLGSLRDTGSFLLYKPRQVVFNEGGPCAALYLVCRGAVKLYCSDRFGREHIVDVAGPGSVLGELPLDSEQPISVSAEAITETQLCVLGRERLAALLEKQPSIGLRLLEALSSELAATRRKVRDLALKSAEGRLAGLLMQLAGYTSNGTLEQQISVPYTRREIAEMIGVSTETAIRLISGLKDKRIIEASGRHIVITDPESLARIASHESTHPPETSSGGRIQNTGDSG